MPRNAPGQVRLLQADISEDGESDLRILFKDKFVKHLKIDGDIWDPDDIPFEPALVELLPELPDGDWDYGHISKDQASATGPDTIILKTSKRIDLPTVRKLWHPVVVDYLDLRIGERLRSNLYGACMGTFPGQPNDNMVIKFARFPWEVSFIDQETAIYKLLDRTLDICPRFLGYVSEHGRVMGFMLERIVGFRHAGVKDLRLCQVVLGGIHALGISMEM